MSNPRFYAGELASNVYTMSLAESPTYPLSNLSTYIPTDEWSSSANTNAQTLSIDLGSAKAIDTIILHNHNLNLMTTVKLQVDAAGNPAFSSPVDVVANLVTGATAGIFKTEFGATTKRYWRILFTDTNAVIPAIGQLFLSSKFDVGQPYDAPFEGGNDEYETAQKTSLSGVDRASQNFGGKTIFKISFSLGGVTFKLAWIAFHNKVRGRLCPFYFADVEDSIYLVKFTQDYNPAETIRYQLNNVQTVTLLKQ